MEEIIILVGKSEGTTVLVLGMRRWKDSIRMDFEGEEC
jgi:hypothetical protein